MAIDPYAMDASGGSPSYAAQEVRLAAGAAFLHGSNALGVRSGVIPNAGLTALQTTAQGTPNMTVNVAVGQAVVQGSTTTTQGPYVYSLDTAKTVTIAAAHATLPRIDVVAVRVRDSNVSGTGLDGDIVAITGTAASTPSAPGFPADGASYLALAHINVGAAAPNVSSGNITNLQTWTTSVGGTLLVSTRTGLPLPTAVPVGTRAYIAAELTEVTSDGTAWGDGLGLLKSYTPSWTATTTNPALGNGSIVGRYKQLGSLVWMEVTITMGSTTTYGTGAYIITAPPSLPPVGRPLLAGTLRTGTGTYRIHAEGLSTGFALKAEPSAPTASLQSLTATVPQTLVSTNIIFVSGLYSV